MDDLGGSFALGYTTALVRLPNGDLVTGGNFLSAGGTPAANIARWDGAAWHALGAGVDGPVTVLCASPNGDLFAAGLFTMAGGVPAEGIARWDGASWHALGAGLPGGYVTALAILPDGDLVAGGDLASAGGVPVAQIARWDGVAWNTFTAGTSGGVFAMTWLPSGTLAVGGYFAQFDGRAAPTVANVGTTCPPGVAVLGSGCAGSGAANTLAAVSLPWADATFRAVGTGLPNVSLAVAVTSFTALPAPVPLSVVFASPPGCNLHVAPDILGLLLPTAGSVDSDLFLPNTPPLVGLTFHHQLVVFEIGMSGAITSVTATDALSLTVGGF